MKALGIDAEKGVGAVKPSMPAVLEGKYNPLSRPLFIYVNKKSAARPEVKAFVDFYITHAKELSEEVHYLPLPDGAYQMDKSRFEKLQTGSGFGGVPETGVSVEEVLKREPKSTSAVPSGEK
jgi:phosphate transport system substrate-binding protein